MAVSTGGGRHGQVIMNTGCTCCIQTVHQHAGIVMTVLTGHRRIAPAGVNSRHYGTICGTVTGGTVSMYCQTVYCIRCHMTGRTGAGIIKEIVGGCCRRRGRAMHDGAGGWSRMTVFTGNRATAAAADNGIHHIGEC